MFKKVFSLLICLSLLIIVLSCSDYPVNADNDSIVGRWVLNEVALSGRVLSVEEWGTSQSYEFKTDNTYQYFVNQQLVETGLFSITTGDQVQQLNLNPSGNQFYFWINEGKLYMLSDNLLGTPTLTFVRQ